MWEKYLTSDHFCVFGPNLARQIIHIPVCIIGFVNIWLQSQSTGRFSSLASVLLIVVNPVAILSYWLVQCKTAGSGL